MWGTLAIAADTFMDLQNLPGIGCLSCQRQSPHRQTGQHAQHLPTSINQYHHVTNMHLTAELGVSAGHSSHAAASVCRLPSAH